MIRYDTAPLGWVLRVHVAKLPGDRACSYLQSLRLLAHAPEPFIRGELRFAAALADPHVEMNADSRQSPLTPSAESPPPAPTLRGQAVTCSPNGASSSGGDPDPEDLF